MPDIDNKEPVAHNSQGTNKQHQNPPFYDKLTKPDINLKDQPSSITEHAKKQLPSPVLNFNADQGDGNTNIKKEADKVVLDYT
jgi:hypothetical protein